MCIYIFIYCIYPFVLFQLFTISRYYLAEKIVKCNYEDRLRIKLNF